MPVQQPVTNFEPQPATADQRANGVCDESLVVRNYDGREAHDLEVMFVDAHGQVAFQRTLSVAPLETISIETRLDRAVYRVEARLAAGATDSAECLVGSDPQECAMVETGNGRVSVVEGPF